MKYVVKKNKAAIDMKYMSYMDIYMAFVLTKTSSLVKGKCVDNSAYFECMGSDNLKDAFNGNLKNKNNRIYLKSVYEMSDEQIDGMINFFKEIDKTCEIDVCKM